MRFIKKYKFYIFLATVLIAAAIGRYYIMNHKVKNDTSKMEIIAEGSGNSYAPEITIEDTTEITSSISEDDTEETETKVYPDYTGEMYDTLDTAPQFAVLSEESYIKLSELDSLGRCGPAEGCVSKDTMPPEGEQRGEIGAIRPTGWVQTKYPGIVDSDPPYIYNRCHLLMWALTNINAEERNLITGTRYMNVNMTTHEMMIVRYIEKTGNHVMYRVTPVFIDNELLCRGLEMEAYSVEDNGEGINFHVFYHNVQPGIVIDYKTGNTTEE